MSDGVKADTSWMRARADECTGTASAVQRLLGPADDAQAGLKRAAADWAFLGSLDEMKGRWEDLNSLLREELEDAAENIRFCASSHDGNENIITEIWHDLFG